MMCLAHWSTGFPKLNKAPSKLKTPIIEHHDHYTKVRYQYRAVSQYNNPVSIWVRTTYDNYEWTSKHAVELCSEYTKRYHKTHATEELVDWLHNNNPITRRGLTPFVQAVPDDIKSQNPVETYRNCYRIYKRNLLKYKNNNAPNWL